MRCRGCGKEMTDGEEHRMVAEWTFCVPCFESLMKGPGKPEESHPPGLTDPAREREESAPSHVPCSVCKRPVRPEEAKKLGIWSFCPECYGELESFARAAEPPEGEDAGAAAEEGGEPEGGIAGVAVELTGFITCKGCGRRIPRGGSKIVDGEPYCPDCSYALSEKEKEKGAASPVFTPPADVGRLASVAAEDGENRCGCCDRPLRKGSYDEVEGFALCRACLSTDPDLAVRIARERHRRLLMGIMKGLEG